MDGTSISTETLTQVRQTESVAEQPNPFAAIADNNQNKVDVADSSRGTHENLDQQALENQMKVMTEMQKARENIASAHVSQGEVGGETIAGGDLSYDEPNQTNAAELQSGEDLMTTLTEKEKETFLTTPESPVGVEAVAVDPTKESVPLKSLIEHPIGPFADFFKKMDEQNYIPKRGEKLIPTLVKGALLPFRIVKTAVESLWEWGEGEITAFMNKLNNFQPKSGPPTTA